MKPLPLIALAASMPLTYAVVGTASFERDAARIRVDGRDRHGPLSLPQQGGVLGAQAIGSVTLVSAAFSSRPLPQRLAIGAAGYGALAGAAALAGIAESRNRAYG